MSLIRYLGRVVLIVSLCIGAAWASLYVFDRWAMDWLGIVPINLPGHDLAGSGPTIRSLDLYPWTGWQAQSDFRHQGDMPWERQPHHDYHVTTGRLGFFEPDVLDVPPKGPCERRVILIGGSGAQGWGAQTNAHTIARRLEAHLSEHKALAGLQPKVFNLAMGASITYQNFIALNRWGHALQPDLIVSYSGRNDYRIVEVDRSDAYYYFSQLVALSEIVRRDTGTGFVAWLSESFPRLMEQTTVGSSLRMLSDYNRLQREAVTGYAQRLGYDRMSQAEFLERVVVGGHIQALKSIKRDFDGIPIALAWQAVHRDELAGSSFAQVRSDFYEHNFATITAALSGYINDGWIFLDAHRYMQQFPKENTGTHLGNAGQDLVGQFIATGITPALEKTRGGCETR